ncbi:VOC family metalloprotein YjdN [Dyella flava]|uniref:VOC family metalloprotein YjdN n=1 Tax=Dyella flava TaxID=1920170 RepID=A0ABS2K3Z1_9GAMM|nr:VOC family metalloprotein YjdN [Dyella flava]MBM7125955.1 VOC family metalloprotein YjdN [Dyella flava]GLQ52302.1 VOC family protein [Dyella flava]
MEIQPYLYFDGRCEEAIAFYGKALGATELFKMRFKDAPSDPAYATSPHIADKIMHAALLIGSTHVLMSDGTGDDESTSHSGFSLSVTADDVASGEKYFNALAQEGKISMPFQKTFWTEGFGMLVDKFGVPWMVNVRQAAP